MKTTLTALILATTLLLLIGCDQQPAAIHVDSSDSPPQLVEGDVNTVSFSVPGMTCEGCAAMVEETLAGADGVEQCIVNLESHSAICKVNPDKFNTEDVLKALADAGYKDSTLKN